MNIGELRRIRNKNVAQQNQLTYLEMKQCAESIGVYPWLISTLASMGQQLDKGFLISLRDIPDQEGVLWYGSWVGVENRFYEFEILTDKNVMEVIRVESWQEVSPEINAHKKGMGKTPAYIALELLSEYEKRLGEI